jgi:hypothetical protein
LNEEVIDRTVRGLNAEPGRMRRMVSRRKSRSCPCSEKW